jgi:hypothetical protein
MILLSQNHQVKDSPILSWHTYCLNGFCNYYKPNIHIMKKIQFLAALCAIGLLFTTSSCKKDSSGSATCGSGLLCADVDGVNYTGDPYNTSASGFFGLNTNYNGSYAQLIANSNTTGGYYLNVSGNNGTGSNGATWQIDFEVTQLPVNGGTYSTTAGSAKFDYYSGSSSNQLHYMTDATHTGTVTINNIDTVNNLVSGTFSYTAYEAAGQSYTPTTHTITSGSFTNLILRR